MDSVSVTLTRSQWAVVQDCLHDLAWAHGYAIGGVRQEISSQLDEED